MTADASQAALPLGWFLLLSAPVFVVCGLLWLFADGAERIDEALAQLADDDDEPVPYLPTGGCEPCCCGGCEQAKELARARIRARLADLARFDWTPEVEAELARIADGGR